MNQTTSHQRTTFRRKQSFFEVEFSRIHHSKIQYESSEDLMEFCIDTGAERSVTGMKHFLEFSISRNLEYFCYEL